MDSRHASSGPGSGPGQALRSNDERGTGMTQTVGWLFGLPLVLMAFRDFLV